MNVNPGYGQGTGIEGRFLGLNDEFHDLNKSKIAIQPVAFDKTTTYRHGAQLGPVAMIEASRNLELYDIETDSEVYLEGIHTCNAIEADDSQKMLKNTYDQTIQLLKQNKFIVTVGGEHSISYAPIKAHTEYFPGLTVLQFDAHADLQQSYDANPWSHACVMARVLELPSIKKIVSVGIRSMSKDEKLFIDQTTAFFAQQLFEDSSYINQILKAIDSTDVYITLDLDVFDSSLMPSTGTPEPGGLFWHQVLPIIKKVAEKKNIVGLDVVELCPNVQNPAPDFLAAKLIYKILSYKFKFQSRPL